MPGVKDKILRPIEEALEIILYLLTLTSRRMASSDSTLMVILLIVKNQDILIEQVEIGEFGVAVLN